MHEFLEGFLLQASLIFALGAQNIFVLESGLRRERHLAAAFVCSACDIFLIALGVLGAASIFVRVPALKIAFGVLGVAFLAYYGFLKLKEGLVPEEMALAESAPKLNLSAQKVMLLALSFSLLNPHVYLDTVILIGGYSAKFLALSDRALFGLGAGTFSTLWFFGLSLGAAWCSPILKDPRAMKRVAFVSGLILITLSAKLGWDVYGWVRP